MPQEGLQSNIQSDEQQRRFLVEPKQDTQGAILAEDTEFPTGHQQETNVGLRRMVSPSWPVSKGVTDITVQPDATNFSAKERRGTAGNEQPQVNSGMLRNSELEAADFTHEHDGFPRHPIRVQDHRAYFHESGGRSRPQPTNPELKDRINYSANSLKELGFRVSWKGENFRVTGRSNFIGGFLGENIDWRQLIGFTNVEQRSRMMLPDQTGEETRYNPKEIGEKTGEVSALGPMHQASWDHVMTRKDVQQLMSLKAAGLSRGANKTTFFVVFKDGSKGIYKSATEESEVERLVSKFAKEFIDPGLVPEVQSVDLGKGPGHVMKVVDGVLAHDIGPDEVLSSPSRVRSFAWMTAMDVALGNPDRHENNFLVDLDADQLWAIDNGLAFGTALNHADPLLFDSEALGIPDNLAKDWYTELGALADKWEDSLPAIQQFFDTNPEVRGRFYDEPPASYISSVRWTIYSIRLAIRNFRSRTISNALLHKEEEDGDVREGDKGGFHTECERKFKVNKDALGELEDPWMLVQAYFDDLTDQGYEHNIRVIASRGRSYERIKDLGMGCRQKLSNKVSFEDAVNSVFKATRVAVKCRYMVRDEEGRAWLIDYFPAEDWWQAETEFESKDEMNDQHMTPVWCGEELTQHEIGYSRNHAKPMGQQDIADALKFAYEHGSKAEYSPAELRERGEEFQFKALNLDGAGPGGATASMTGGMVHTDVGGRTGDRKKTKGLVSHTE